LELLEILTAAAAGGDGDDDDDDNDNGPTVLVIWLQHIAILLFCSKRTCVTGHRNWIPALRFSCFWVSLNVW